MRYSILASNRSGAVRYYPQKWSWSLRRFGRAFGWQFFREFGDSGNAISFGTLSDAEEYLEFQYTRGRQPKPARNEKRLRWTPKL